MSHSGMPRGAGIVLYRLIDGRVEVLLWHMGGPFWARKDSGAWTIPKGEYDANEDALAAARREFAEEIGVPTRNGAAYLYQQTPGGIWVEADTLRALARFIAERDR